MGLQTKKRALMNSVQSGGRLPSAYQEVEWIGNQEDGGLPYIDTGLSPRDTYIYNFEIEPLKYPKTSATYLGSGLTWNNAINITENRIEGIRRFCWGAMFESLSPSTIGVKYDVEMAQRYFIINGFTYTRRAFSTNYTTTMYLFNRNYGTPQLTSDIAILKWYSYSVKEDGEYLQKFIPCYRKADGEIGMYDVINDVFYTNQGTGTFTKGSNV